VFAGRRHGQRRPALLIAAPHARKLSSGPQICSPARIRKASRLESGQPNGETTLVQIFVRDNNVDQALKALKKKMQREGSFREMKRHVHYEKPSEKRARQKAEAVRRARKLARKRAQREGLLPMPKKPVGAR
jgi:small subunit ribosomal protein S21